LVGSGDFNDDGYSDLLLWNATTQSGMVKLMNDATTIATVQVQPATPSDWNVIGIADFYQSGYSNILLRDSGGNLEMIFFGPSGVTGTSDFKAANLNYSSSPYFQQQNGSSVTGKFDTNWDVVAVGGFAANGYPGILWSNRSDQPLGVSNCSPTTKNFNGQVFAELPKSEKIIAAGDFNGDGVKDLLLSNIGQDAAVNTYTLWYIGYFAGQGYQVGPSFQQSSDWQIQDGPLQ
jgi:hypothetical protein